MSSFWGIAAARDGRVVELCLRVRVKVGREVGLDREELAELGVDSWRTR